VDRALVEMWQRRMELELFRNVTGTFQNTHKFFEGRIPQVPAYGEVCREAARKRLAWLDEQRKGAQWICGDRFTLADIALYVALEFGTTVGQPIDPKLAWVNDWMKRVAARPSATASLHPKAVAAGMKG
jgi:glutathione S-transferase